MILHPISPSEPPLSPWPPEDVETLPDRDRDAAERVDQAYQMLYRDLLRQHTSMFDDPNATTEED